MKDAAPAFQEFCSKYFIDDRTNVADKFRGVQNDILRGLLQTESLLFL